MSFTLLAFTSLHYFTVNANIEEYIKIVAAGMVGTTPHMISATITALSRLIFEFQGALACLSILSQ